MVKLPFHSLLGSLDAEVTGHMQLTLNVAQGYVEGELNGNISLGQSNLLNGVSLTAQGQLDWHLGIDYISIQGAVSMTIMGTTALVTGTGVNLGAGFYLGIGAPKSDAWVLLGASPQYALNTSAMPDKLTGVYGYLNLTEGVSLFVVSGQYNLFVGLGVFSIPVVSGLPPGILSGPLYVVGNVGGSINGEILGGLVSAGANFDLQIIGPFPFSFQGTVGLSACVLWVACGSVSLTIGLNSSQGFFIQ